MKHVRAKGAEAIVAAPERFTTPRLFRTAERRVVRLPGFAILCAVILTVLEISGYPRARTGINLGTGPHSRPLLAARLAPSSSGREWLVPRWGGRLAVPPRLARTQFDFSPAEVDMTAAGTSSRPGLVAVPPAPGMPARLDSSTASRLYQWLPGAALVSSCE
jgi:hypothetical protein